jgi:iron complex transport system ATP-binding protein
VTQLRLVDLVVNGRDRPRLQVDALTLSPGITVVVGKNGAGKSTLLDVVAGVLPPASGQVRLDDDLVFLMAPATRARRIASLGQRPRAAPWLLVSERIAQGLIPRCGVGASSSPAVRSAVVAIAARLGIEAELDRPLVDLSGGQQQRAHIARSLVDEEASVVVLDEPMSGLDESGAAMVARLLQARAQAGVVVVVSVHDLGLAASLAGRVLGIEAGAIVVDSEGLVGVRAAAPLLGEGLRVVEVDGAIGVLRTIAPGSPPW